MRALIKKDFYNCYCTSPIWIIMMLVYISAGVLTDQVFFLSFSAMIPALLVNSTISADEAIKWEPFALAMPVSRRQLVYSRYLFGFLNLLMIGAFMLLCGMIGHFLGLENISQRMMMLPLLGAVGTLVMALNIPLEIRFGGTRGHLMSVLCMGGIIAVCLGVGTVVSVQANAWNDILELLLRKQPILLLAAAVIISLAVSVYLSIHFQEKKNY